jgi:hypothetical protein
MGAIRRRPTMVTFKVLMNCVAKSVSRETFKPTRWSKVSRGVSRCHYSWCKAQHPRTVIVGTNAPSRSPPFGPGLGSTSAGLHKLGRHHAPSKEPSMLYMLKHAFTPYFSYIMKDFNSNELPCYIELNNPRKLIP